MEDRSLAVKKNGNGVHALVPRDGAPPPLRRVRPEDAPMVGLVDVARDAFDHGRVIVRDGIALGKLEAKEVIARGKSEVKTAVKKVEDGVTSYAPRVAFGLNAMVFGFVGLIFGFIALFMGLGYVLPSVAARMGIFTALFLAIAGVSAFLAARDPKKSKKTDKTEPPYRADGTAVRRIAPVHPAEGLGE